MPQLSQRLSNGNTRAGLAALRAAALVRRRRAGEDVSRQVLLEALDDAVVAGVSSFALIRLDVMCEARGFEAVAREARRDAHGGDVDAAAWLSGATTDPLESTEMLRIAVEGGSVHAGELVEVVARHASSIAPGARGDASRALESWVGRLDRADAERGTAGSFRTLWDGLRTAEVALEEMGVADGVEAVRSRRFALVREYVGTGSVRAGSSRWRQEVASALSEWWREVVPSAEPTFRLFEVLAARHVDARGADAVMAWVDALAPGASDDDLRSAYGALAGHGSLSLAARSVVGARQPGEIDRLEIELKEHPELHVAHAAALAHAAPAAWADEVRRALARDVGDLEDGARRYVDALLSHVWLDVLARRDPGTTPFAADRTADLVAAVRSAALGAGGERSGVDEAYVDWLLGEGPGASIHDPVAEAATVRHELTALAAVVAAEPFATPFDRVDVVGPLVRALRDRDDQPLETLLGTWRSDPDALASVAEHIAPAELFRLAERTSDMAVLRALYPETLRRHPGDRLLARQAAYILPLETRHDALRDIAEGAPSPGEAVDVLLELGRNHLRWRMTDRADEVFAEAAGLDPTAAGWWVDALVDEHEMDVRTGVAPRDLLMATEDLFHLRRRLDEVDQAEVEEPVVGRRSGTIELTLDELPNHFAEGVTSSLHAAGADDLGLLVADKGFHPALER